MNRYTEAFNRLLVQLNPICEKYGKSKSWFLIDALGAFIRYGVTPNEYIGFSFYKLSSLERKQYYTARHSRRYDKKMLKLDCRDAFENKVMTNKLFSKFVNRDWLYTADATVKEIELFIANHAKMIVKPIRMAQGKGVHVYKEESASELKEQRCLLESFVVQHKDMATLNPSSVNTVRVYTLITSILPPSENSLSFESVAINAIPSVSLKSDKYVHFICASIRVGGKGAEIDNYHAGGVGYPIDIETGIVYKPGIDIMGNRCIFHPSTHAKVVGFQIPQWVELKQFVAEAAMQYPQVGQVAWDIAVLDNGFELIEANLQGNSGFMQAPSGEGKLRIIKKYREE